MQLDLRSCVEEVLGRARERDDGQAGLHQLVCATTVATELHELADAVVTQFVVQARHGGATWGEVGSVLGVTKQAAQQRYGEVAPPYWRPATERLAAETKRALVEAQKQARRDGSAVVGTEHVLLGLVSDEHLRSVRLLRRAGPSPTRVRRALAPDPAHPAPANAGGRGRAPLGPLARRAIVLAGYEARERGAAVVGCDHLLVGVAGITGGRGAVALRELGVDAEGLRAALGSLAPATMP